MLTLVERYPDLGQDLAKYVLEREQGKDPDATIQDNPDWVVRCSCLHCFPTWEVEDNAVLHATANRNARSKTLPKSRSLQRQQTRQPLRSLSDQGDGQFRRSGR